MKFSPKSLTDSLINKNFIDMSSACTADSIFLLLQYIPSTSGFCVQENAGLDVLWTAWDHLAKTPSPPHFSVSQELPEYEFSSIPDEF